MGVEQDAQERIEKAPARKEEKAGRRKTQACWRRRMGRNTLTETARRYDIQVER